MGSVKNIQKDQFANPVSIQLIFGALNTSEILTLT